MTAGAPPDPGHGGSPDGAAGGGLRAALQRLAFANPLYHVTLGGGAPASLAAVPREPWPGDPAEGDALLAGRFAFAGEIHDVAAPAGGKRSAEAAMAAQLFTAPAGPGWQQRLQAFDWLVDLRAVGGDSARRLARAALAVWLQRHKRWSPLAWAPGTLGRRVANWLGQHDFLLASADDELRSTALASLARQGRHLARLAGMGGGGAEAIAAAKGLTYATVCLPPLKRHLPAAEKLLARALASQVLPDGGHVSRNPAVHMAVLRDLIDMRALLRQAQLEVPAELQHGIDRMTPMLRFFRLGDGGLTQAGGGGDVGREAVKLTLTHADMRGKPLKNASHSGYQRLAHGGTVAILDAGALPPPGQDSGAHAGLLGFEMAAGRERIIVNCGAQPAVDRAWRDSQRATAAHSTVVLDDRNCVEVVPGAGLVRRPQQVWANRQDSSDGSLVEAGHDGYAPVCGARVQRLLYLGPSGDDLRGEDRVTGPEGHAVAVRFHLHPDVRAAVATDGATVLLRLPAGAGWRLRCMGATLALADSVYLGEPGRIRRSQQVVLTTTTQEGETTIKWALQRETG